MGADPLASTFCFDLLFCFPVNFSLVFSRMSIYLEAIAFNSFVIIANNFCKLWKHQVGTSELSFIVRGYHSQLHQHWGKFKQLGSAHFPAFSSKWPRAMAKTIGSPCSECRQAKHLKLKCGQGYALPAGYRRDYFPLSTLGDSKRPFYCDWKPCPLPPFFLGPIPCVYCLSVICSYKDTNHRTSGPT